MYRFLISFVFISFTSLYSQNENIVRETKIDFTTQFWMESKHAITDSFLIKVFLPPDYFKSDTTYFPVLFVTDADAFWGAATDYPYFLHWQKPSIIVVGISYGSWEEGWGKRKRQLDLMPLPNQEKKVGAEHFLTFLSEELLPKVESEYRIDSKNRTLFGWSAGGMFALYAVFKQPELFRNFIAVGVPPVYQRDEWAFRMEEEYSKKRNDLPVKLYMGVGEHDATAYPQFHDFAHLIEERGYRNLEFKWEVLPKFKHEYEAAVALLGRGLQYIFFPQSIFQVILETINQEGIEKAIATYNKLKSTAAGDYNFAEVELNRLAYFLLNTKRVDEAISLFKLNIEAYPQSANVYDSLADGYMAAGNKDRAKEYVLKTLEMLPQDPYASEAEKEQIKEWANEKLKRLQNEQ